jgi:hydrogenase maturation protein HypF
MAVAHLDDAGQGDALVAGRVPAAALAAVRRLIDRRINTPLTSSAGRLFDAVAALIGLCDRVTYEGQGAIELEWLATAAPSYVAAPFDFDIAGVHEPGVPLSIDTRPIIAGITAEIGLGSERSHTARRFHLTLVEIVAQVCARLRQKEGLDVVVLSGGVFQNALITTEVITRLERDGFRVYRHKKVPPGDGGLSLGQLAIAAAAGAPTITPGTKSAENVVVPDLRSN